MLPTSRWKLRIQLRQIYSDRIVYLEDGLKKQREMASEFLDSQDLSALSALHLTIIQDEEEIVGLKEKLDLLNDDAFFENVFNEQKESLE
jgi:hypothetical protein